MNSTAITLDHVSKIYRRYGGRQFSTLKSALLSGDLVRKLRPEETFQALKDVSFTVPKGCTYGVVGRNGSGKSTALKLVAGITKPTIGTVTVEGRISALIELGAGFHPEISGRENVFINGIMLGLTKKAVSYTHLRAHETVLDLVCRLLLEKKNKNILDVFVLSSPHRVSHTLAPYNRISGTRLTSKALNSCLHIS